MRIRYISPFATDKNIGREYNEVISELPDDSYVVIRDGDVMFLTHDWGNIINRIIQENPDFDIIGCATNRLGLDHQVVKVMFDKENMGEHIWTADLFSEGGAYYRCTQHNMVAGMLMIFKKSLWKELGGFTENPQKARIFDKLFCIKAKKSGKKIGVSCALYVFHLYRWGKDNPKHYDKHLLI